MNKNTDVSCSGGGCLGFIVFVFVLFHLGDIWTLLNHGLNYLLNLK